MTETCPHITWCSFVPIFLKLDRDITKIMKTFLGGGGVNWIRDYLKWWWWLVVVVGGICLIQSRFLYNTLWGKGSLTSFRWDGGGDGGGVGMEGGVGMGWGGWGMGGTNMHWWGGRGAHFRRIYYLVSYSDLGSPWVFRGITSLLLFLFLLLLMLLFLSFICNDPPL